MFMKTMAVGPFAPRACCEATVALPLLHCEWDSARTDVAELIQDIGLAAARVNGTRRAIVEETRGEFQSH